MRRMFLVGLLLAGCAEPTPQSTPPARPTPPPQLNHRQLTPRDQLPEVIQPLLPARGIYVAGGGMVSSAWRIVVDRDARTIVAGTAAGPNAASFGKLDRETTKPLSARNDEHLMALAEDAWREPPAAEPPRPTADYDEILIVVDGPQAFLLQGYGPIKQPLAARAIVELRAAAGM